jgi:hypothetical protein
LSGTGNDTITIGRSAGTLSNLGHFIINGQDRFGCGQVPAVGLALLKNGGS